MATRTVGFAVAEEDWERLDRLVEHFGHGNRSAFLRAALDVMAAAERAERLRDLQAYGTQRLAESGRTLADIPSIVTSALAHR